MNIPAEPLRRTVEGFETLPGARGPAPTGGASAPIADVPPQPPAGE